MRQRWTAVLIVLWSIVAPLLTIALNSAPALAAAPTGCTWYDTATINCSDGKYIKGQDSQGTTEFFRDANHLIYVAGSTPTANPGTNTGGSYYELVNGADPLGQAISLANPTAAGTPAGGNGSGAGTTASTVLKCAWVTATSINCNNEIFNGSNGTFTSTTNSTNTITGVSADFGSASATINGAQMSVVLSNTNVAATAAAADSTKNTDCDAGSGFTWLVCAMIRGVIKVVDLVRDKIIMPFLYQPPLDKNSDEYKPAYAIWQTVRDLAGVIFILLFVLLIFGTAIGFDNYTIKKALPHLIAGAILMPLSWYICAAIVDLGNILGGGIVQVVNAALPHNTHIDLTSNMTSVFLAGAATAGTFALLGAVSGIGLGLAFTMLIAFAGVFFTLIFRKVLLTILIVISPLAMAAWVLPNTEKWTRKWWDNIIKVVMMYPIIMLLFMLGRIFSATASATTGKGTDFTVPLFQIVGLVLPLFAVPWAFKMSGSGMAMGQNAINKVAKAADRRVGKDSDLAKTWQQNREMRNHLNKDKFADRAAAARTPFGKAINKTRSFVAGSRTGTKTWFRGATGQLAAEEARSKAYAAMGKVDAAKLKQEGQLTDENGNPVPKETSAARLEAETAMAAAGMVQGAGRRQGVRQAVSAAGGSAGGIGGYAMASFNNAEQAEFDASNKMVGSGKAVRDTRSARPTASQTQSMAYGNDLGSRIQDYDATRRTLTAQAALDDKQQRSMPPGPVNVGAYGINMGARMARVNKAAALHGEHLEDEIISKDVDANLHAENEAAHIAREGRLPTISERAAGINDERREASIKAAETRRASIRTAGQVSNEEVRAGIERKAGSENNKALGTITGTNEIAKTREIEQLGAAMPGRASYTPQEFAALHPAEQQRLLSTARDEMHANDRAAGVVTGKEAENARLAESAGILRGVAQGEEAIMLNDEADRLQAADPVRFADRQAAEAEAANNLAARTPNLNDRRNANRRYFNAKAANLQDAKALQIAGEMGQTVGTRNTLDEAAGLARLDAETQRILRTDPHFDARAEADRLVSSNIGEYEHASEYDRLKAANPTMGPAELEQRARMNIRQRAEQAARGLLLDRARDQARMNLDPNAVASETDRLLATNHPDYNIEAEKNRVRAVNPAMTDGAVLAQAQANVRARARAAATVRVAQTAASRAGATTAVQGQQALIRSAATAGIEQGKRTQAQTIASTLALNTAAQSNTNLNAADLILTAQRNAEASQAAQEGAANARNAEPQREYSEMVNLALESESDKMRVERVGRAGNETYTVRDEDNKPIRTVPITTSGLGKDELRSLEQDAMAAFDAGNLDRMAAIMQKLTESGGGRDAVRRIATAKLGRSETQVVNPSNPQWVKYYQIGVSKVGDNAPDLKLPPAVAFDELSAEDFAKLDQRTMRERMLYASDSDAMDPSREPDVSKRTQIVANRAQAVNEVIGVIEKNITDTRIRGRLKDVQVQRMWEWLHEPLRKADGKPERDDKGNIKIDPTRLRPEIEQAKADGRLSSKAIEDIEAIHRSYSSASERGDTDE